MSSEPTLVSFVLRFVREDASDGADGRAEAAGWHGVIRHVQSSREKHFTRWADAMDFIAAYVPVDAGGGSEGADA